MKDQSYFGIRRDEVSFNHFDAEVIVIHLGRGTYFSLRDSAAMIWDRLEAGPAGARELKNLFTLTDDETESVLATFLEQLSAHGLISVGGAPIESMASDLAPRPFALPMLEVFNDLEGLLVADPIHEASDAGWPMSADAVQKAA